MILHFYLYVFVMFYILFLWNFNVILLIILYIDYFVNIFRFLKFKNLINNFQQWKQLLFFLLFLDLFLFIIINLIRRIILKHKNFSLQNFIFKLNLIIFILIFYFFWWHNLISIVLLFSCNLNSYPINKFLSSFINIA